jgi:hypothetical protein
MILNATGSKARSFRRLKPNQRRSLRPPWPSNPGHPTEIATDEDAVAAQYGGAKANLRPILEKIVSAAEEFGPDVTQNVRKSYVPLVCGNQFANIVPSTRNLVDMAPKLPGVEANDLL